MQLIKKKNTLWVSTKTVLIQQTFCELFGKLTNTCLLLPVSKEISTSSYMMPLCVWVVLKKENSEKRKRWLIFLPDQSTTEGNLRTWAL